ncbi:MAG TPA: ATP-dependent DNA ligase [Micropepsaceae bacterium]|nr:ATP-dependent DNA ligase [Micropepsaceae bacterium]
MGSLPKLGVPLDTFPMEAKVAETLPVGEGWQYEPKWDGFRCLAFRDGPAVELRGKSGKSLTRYFPDVVQLLIALPTRRFVLDGELAIPLGNALSFDALQLRLHPAESRIRKLAKETPAIFICFDMLLGPDNRSLIEASLHRRRYALEKLFAGWADAKGMFLSPCTHSHATARKWLSRAGTALDGVVAKRSDESYQSGERAMLKIKRLRTADCVVGGFRFAEKSREVGSLLLGLYDAEGRLDHVGFTSGFANIDRAKLTAKLLRLRKPPGFTGRAPGGPSRWSTERSGEWEPLTPKLVAEVRYDHVSGDRFRHGTKFLRWRPDKNPHDCTMDQLRAEKRPAALIRDIVKS